MNDTDMLKLILEKISEMNGKMNELKSDVSLLHGEVDEVKRAVRSVELTLENETNWNIRAIADGHHDLQRRLNDALRVEEEKELFIIRLNTLENEVRKMKEKMKLA